jgi:hypothetical protein
MFEDRLNAHLSKGKPFLYGDDMIAGKVFADICSIKNLENLDRLTNPSNWNIEKLLHDETKRCRRPKVDIMFEITSNNNLALNWYPAGFGIPGERNLSDTDFLEFNDMRPLHSIGNNRLFLFKSYGKLCALSTRDLDTANLLWSFLIETIDKSLEQLESQLEISKQNSLKLKKSEGDLITLELSRNSK